MENKKSIPVELTLELRATVPSCCLKLLGNRKDYGECVYSDTEQDVSFHINDKAVKCKCSNHQSPSEKKNTIQFRQ